MQIKLIFTTKVLHTAVFWAGEFLELGNGLFSLCIDMNYSWVFNCLWNGPFPICLKPLFQSEAKCEAIDMKNIFYPHANKTYFHNKDFST